MRIIRKIIDILMFVITILLMDINNTGRFNHEVLGISLTLLLIIHILLNFKWVKQITKNFKKIKLQTKILYFVDVAIFVVYFVTIGLGLVTSSIFNFKISSSLKLMLSHHIFGRLALIFMIIHIGFHLKPLMNKVTKNETFRMIIYIIYCMITILIAMYLFYTLTKSYLWISVM